MLRIVKLNLYNYKLFKEMKENWSNFNDELDQFFNEILKVDLNLKPIDVINLLQKQEKNRFMEINPGTLYFLFDTTENAFVGIARVSFISVDKKDKNFNIEMKISPKFSDKSYEDSLIDQLSKIFFERNKVLPIFRVNKEDTKIIVSLRNNQRSLIKTDDIFFFYQ